MGGEPGAAAPAAAPGLDALPCQIGNNSNKSPKRYRLFRFLDTDFYRGANDGYLRRQLDGDTLVRYGLPNGAEAKAAFHLRRNIEGFIKYWGRNHCLFFTLTDEAGLHPSQFARHWNSFMVRNGMWIRSFIRVLEPQRQGRPHYHILTAVDWDTRPDAFDWEAFFACKREFVENGRTVRFRELRARYKASAVPELVALWSRMRKVLPRYHLGRAEFLSLRKTQEAVAQYLGHYLEGGLVIRRHSWKGCRRVEFDRKKKRSWLACSRVFGWNSPGAKVRRGRIGQLAAAIGVDDMEGIRRRFGPKWAYRLRDALTFGTEEEWQTNLRTIESHANSIRGSGSFFTVIRENLDLK